MADSVVWTLVSGEVSVNITATLDGNGNIIFDYDLASGIADLNGFYIDIGNDGGDITKVGQGNNMKGSDTDGDKLDGFDFAQALGSVGGNDDDNTSGSVTVSMAELGITSLEELAAAEIGIRATSVGEDREDSLKLAATGTFVPDDGGFGAGDFPERAQAISHITLVFKDDVDDGIGDRNDDGYYAVKIDNWDAALVEQKDLDDSIADILTWLQTESGDAFAFNEADLCGAVIKGGNQENTLFFSYGDNNTNGEAPDSLPDGIGFYLEGVKTEQPPNAIDTTYLYADIFF